MRRLGFSLIELLAAIGIVAILAAMITAGMGRDKTGSAVGAAANELAAVLKRARASAMRDQAQYAVVFNIQNAPGSSGRVLNNRSGGHWYRVLGPAWTNRGGNDMTAVPYPNPQELQLGDVSYRSFPHLLEAVRGSWVGEPHVLAPGKVRFLALSDTDEGSRRRGAWAADPVTTWYPATYPRPWFGYFEIATGTLWPWGGYDPSKNFSGFYYEGADGDVSGCRHQATRTYRVDFNESLTWAVADRNGDGDTSDPYETETVTLWQAGQPRPLVNADWVDAGILFLPDGSAMFLPWMQPRRAYNNREELNTNRDLWRRRWCAGVRDMTKTPVATGTTTNDGNRLSALDAAEAVHFDRHTGGWFITLAPDSPDDRYQFTSATEALRSITPMVRVFVGRNGSVRIIPVRADENALAGTTPWPSGPSDWQATGTNAIAWRDCRYGWLHAPNVPDADGDGIPDAMTLEAALSPSTYTSNAASGSTFSAPRGQPVTDRISSSMLSNRIWWTTP